MNTYRNKGLKLLFAAAIWLLATSNITAHGIQNMAADTTKTIVNDTIEADTVNVDTVCETNTSTWPKNIQTRIDKLLDNDIFETSTVGLMVYDLTADSVLYSHNARQLMRPASTLKMMVAVAALDRLGCDYRYRTTMSTTAGQSENVLRGDIYFHGGFDPMIDNGDLDRFVDSLRALGVDTLRGNIISDLSMKDDDLLGEGWCWDDDNPVLSPLLVNRKNEFAERFTERLRRAGIVFDGELRTGHTPRVARTLCTIERPIGDVMERMLKESDNLYSESMFYQLAASTGGTATARQGRTIINRLIDRLGLKPSRYYIADGSGLSLYNYVSPELEVAFLRHAYRSDCVLTMLMKHLPVAGEDGTLDKRMRRGRARGNVHAKTGTVTGVSSLAGYCTSANGHRLCFSIINMGIRHASSGRNFQDRVCEALCR